jgi:hypothetical protein
MKRGLFLYTVVYYTYNIMAIRFVYGIYTVQGSAVYAPSPSLQVTDVCVNAC